MSRSNPTQVNPATRFLRWKGSTGNLVYYDRDLEKEVEVPAPFDFLVLDVLATITGYNEQDESGYWSNEVRNVTNEEFVVKTSAGVKQSGLYKDLGEVRSKGAKYASSIYIYADGQIMNLKASGGALTSWIEFARKADVYKVKVSLTGKQQEKKGATVYYTPKFEYGAPTEAEERAALEADKKLQDYLGTYLSAPKFGRDHEEADYAISDVAPEEVPEESIDLSGLPW